MGRAWAVAAITLAWALLTIHFYASTRNEYALAPFGDAAYFADMAQVFYRGGKQTLAYPQMHGRRVLVPALVGWSLRAFDAVLRPSRADRARDHYATDPEAVKTWTPEDHHLYHRLARVWRALNVIALAAIFAALFGIVAHLLGPDFSTWWAGTVALVITAIPALGRIYIAWPIMNDLPALALGLLALLALLKARVVVSGVLCGMALLGRENMAFVYPCFLWLLLPRRRKDLICHAALTFAPFLALVTFPPFPKILVIIEEPWKPAFPRIAEYERVVSESVPGPLGDYLHLVAIHVDHLLRPDSLALLGAAYWLAGGPLLLVTLRFYPWREKWHRDALLWASVLLIVATAFFVDRYAVYVLFPLLLLSRHRLGRPQARLYFLVLTALYVVQVRLFDWLPGGAVMQIYETRDLPLWPRYAAGVGAVLLIISRPERLIGLRRLLQSWKEKPRPPN